jgi:hypothetical protein
MCDARQRIAELAKKLSTVSDHFALTGTLTKRCLRMKKLFGIHEYEYDYRIEPVPTGTESEG